MPPQEPHEDLMMVNFENRITRLERLVESLTEKFSDMDKDFAVLQKDISYIKETQDKQTNGINKILWAIGLSFLSYFGIFVMNGGLSTIGQ